MTGPDSRLTVAVLFGGRSSEHSISCLSAGNVIRALDPARYNVVPIGITPEGRWVLQSDDTARLVLVDGQLPHVDAVGEDRELSAAPERNLALAGGPIDVVFPVLHGPWGEDGTVQGLLEMAGIPYVGSGVLASAAGMDKGFMKALLAAAGLTVGPYEVITDRQWRSDRGACADRLAHLGDVVFVKPARAGSSVGITRVVNALTDRSAVEAAVDAAREHDPRVVVEAAIGNAREVECAVLVDESGAARASVCGEIIVREGHDFYDFAAKYLDDAVDLVVPADLSVEVSDEVRAVAIAAFDALGCEGLARVDVFVRDTGEVVVNEVNTMPGFTAISMYPRMWAATGIDYPALVDRLIADALRRGTGLR